LRFCSVDTIIKENLSTTMTRTRMSAAIHATAEMLFFCSPWCAVVFVLFLPFLQAVLPADFVMLSMLMFFFFICCCGFFLLLFVCYNNYYTKNNKQTANLQCHTNNIIPLECGFKTPTISTQINPAQTKQQKHI